MTRDVKTSGITIKRVPAKNAVFVDFKVKREDWNLYRIEDGTLLRAKFILTGVWLDDSLDVLEKRLKEGLEPDFGFGFRSRQLYAVEPPPELRGSPDSKRYNQAQIESFIEKKDMDFETVRATWNIYELENGITVKIRLSPISINRTTKFDSGGMRIYTVNGNADVKPEFPEHIENLFKERLKKARAKDVKRRGRRG